MDDDVHVSLMLRRKTETIGGVAKEIGNLLHLTHEDLATRHGASDSDIALVEQFAHEYGLTVVEASAAKAPRGRGRNGRGDAKGIRCQPYLLHAAEFR